MRLIWWVVAALVGLLTLGAIVSAVLMALQILVYVVAFCAAAWVLTKAFKLYDKYIANKPP